ncbi:membrane fusion protein, multidrug efflux system [Xaviernesmea oryzae]|nr:efflux RND transporter periplasmic adaptor subunit [Xaviernesmea oryzae]SEL93187.1 membrane fusion protein, multidrug efflux system [Xaviernesmea oryzae]
MPTTRSLRLTTALTLAALALAACQQEQKQEQAAPAMPPAQVAVVTAKSESLPIINELPGRIAATRIAEVRPRVSGILIERVFEQGSTVKQGDVLYRIDPAPFQVQVESAQATLERAHAAQLQARQTAERQEQLRRSNVSSQQAFDEAQALLAQAQADVRVAEAGLATARLNLEYASVTAPISGRIGRALITEGALVSASGSENLATIQQLDPVYADFTQSATDLIRLRRALKDGQMMTADNEAEVQLVLDDGTLYPQKGKLLFTEAAVDETTGQVTLRGEFPNPNGDLLPGMYVRVQIQQGVDRNAIAIPQQAVQRDAGGRAQVFVVNGDKKVEMRTIGLGRTLGARWVVNDGLKAGDRVIVEGVQKIGPGAAVEPSEWNPNAAAEGGSTVPQQGDGGNAQGDGKAPASQPGGKAAPAAQGAPTEGGPAPDQQTPAGQPSAAAPAAKEAAPARDAGKGQDTGGNAAGQTGNSQN